MDDLSDGELLASAETVVQAEPKALGFDHVWTTRNEVTKLEATIVLREEAVPVVRSSLELKRKALEASVRHYGGRLGELEREHGMASEEFARRYQAGELGDEPAWFEWEFVLDSQREAERQLELLDSVKL